MKEPDLRELLGQLDVEVLHKNYRGWLVALLSGLLALATLLMLTCMKFKPIPQQPDFEISDDGTVIRRHKASQPMGWGARLGKPIYVRKDDGRYHRVKLNGKVYLVHVLVCSAFRGEAPAGKPLALHRNDIPTDNRVKNLYWGTREQNIKDARRNGRILSGELASNAKLTWEIVDQLRALKGAASERALSQRFGIPRSTINWVLSGRSWHEETRLS